MNWTFEHNQHRHREDLQRAERKRLADKSQQDNTPIRRGVRGKLQPQRD